jgi:RNA polymerase sigma-70 factor (ECF subfamily)
VTDRTTGISGRLVAKARRGDPEALKGLVEYAYPVVRRWALVQTGEPADADDLTQDVLIRMIRRLETFQGDARFDTWLYAMTRNAALDRIRKSGRTRRISDDPLAQIALEPRGAPDPSRRVELDELREMLETFFHDLPPRQREVFDLVELQGYAASEAAEIMGVAAASVRAHLFKARRRLRERILSERPEVASDLR